MINDLYETPFFSDLWSTRMLTIPTLPFYNALSGRFTTWHWGVPQISLSWNNVISVCSFILKCCQWNFFLIIDALVEVQFGLTVLGRSNKKAPCLWYFFHFHQTVQRINNIFVIFPSLSGIRKINSNVFFIFSIFIIGAKDKQCGEGKWWTGGAPTDAQVDYLPSYHF